MSTRVTILGCGSSGGVPRVGQGWGACDPAEPRNRRRRCSILIEAFGQSPQPTTVLVDTSPDLREQLLTTDTRRLDAVVLTHDHADHTHGLDDLRPLTLVQRQRVPVYTFAETVRSMRQRFSYCFETPEGSGYPPILDMHEVDLQGRFTITGPGAPVQFDTFRVIHGTVDVLGLKFNNCVYTPDISSISSETEHHYDGLDVWIIDALRPAPHPSHFSLPETLAWIDRKKPRRAILTNLHTDLDYRQLCASLPASVEPAYDGMTLDI